MNKLAAFIQTRDRRIAKTQPWSPTPLMDYMTALLQHGSVIVGGRASCGSTDPTWRIFTSWNEVVSKAKKLGIHIAVTSIKHKNGWATAAGGFWDENEYTTAPNPDLVSELRT